MDSAGEATPDPARLFFPALDSLRAVFSLTVVVFHIALIAIIKAAPTQYPALFSGVVGVGAFGVPFFFVLSSFLITLLLLQERSATGNVAVAAFYGRRALRVWPVYFAALGLGFLVVEPLSGHPPAPQWLAPYLLFVANNYMAAPGFTVPSMSVAPLWSVSIEEQFYLVWPWVARWANPRVLTWLGVGLVAAAPVVRDFRFDVGATAHEQHWYMTLTHLDSFGAGVLAALAHRAGRGRWLKRHLGVVAGGCLTGVMLVQLTTHTLLGLPTLDRLGIWAYTLVPMMAGALVLAAAQPSEAVAKGWKLGPLLWLGKVSYGIYAYHGFWIVLLGEKMTASPTDVAARALGIIALTVACAWFSHLLMERPLLRLKSRLQVVPSGA